MKVLSFSTLYPSPANPTAGIFVHRRQTALARRVSLEMVHAIAACPLIGPIRDRGAAPAVECVDGVTVYRRNFHYLPGVLKRMDGYFMGRGLLSWTRRYCSEHRPDILDAQFDWPDAVSVSWLAGLLGMPFMVTLRGKINSRYPRRCFRGPIASALRAAAAVVSVSRPMADLAIELGAEPSAVHVIPNGINADQFQMVPRTDARRQLGLMSSEPVVVCVASLTPGKGHEDLIEAIAALGQSVCLVLVGGQAGGAYKRHIEALAARWGVAKRLVFTGRQEPQVVAAYLNAADLSVLASHAEGCPNVVIESLACGTPVAATTVGGVADLVKPGLNGYLAKPADVSSMTRAIRLGLGQAWSRQAIRQSVIGRSWDVVADEVAAVLHQALVRHSGNRRTMQ